MDTKDKKDKKTNEQLEKKVVDIKEAPSAAQKEALKKMEERLTNMLKDPVIKYLEENEVGDAKLYVKVNRDNIVFDLSSKDTWLAWNGHNWESDIDRKPVAAVDNVNDVYNAKLEEIEDILKDFAGFDKDDPIKSEYIRLFKDLKFRITTLNSRRRRENVIHLAKAYGIGVPPDIWDRNPMLLGCANGVLELDTGNFMQGRKEDYIRSFSPTEWNGANEPCPLWEETLDKIFAGDKDKIAFVQRVFGYALLGNVKDHAFFVLHGTLGNNGKGVLMRTVSGVLGKRLASSIRSELLTKSKVEKSEGSANTALMTLRGKRLVWAPETEGVFSIEKVKWLSGGDDLTGRNNYDITDSEWKPSHTMFIQTNNIPHVASDKAFFNRLHVIEFTESFVPNPTNPHEHKVDTELEEKLKAEYSGILAWMWVGSYKFLKYGLNPPESIQKAKEEYIEDEDTLGRFIKAGFSVVPEQERDEELEFIKNPMFRNYKEQLGEVHLAYTRWCDEVGIKKPITVQLLGKEFVKKGFIKKPVHAGKVFIFGIKFLDHKWNRESRWWTKEVDVEDYDE